MFLWLSMSLFQNVIYRRARNSLKKWWFLFGLPHPQKTRKAARQPKKAFLWMVPHPVPLHGGTTSPCYVDFAAQSGGPNRVPFWWGTPTIKTMASRGGILQGIDDTPHVCVDVATVVLHSLDVATRALVQAFQIAANVFFTSALFEGFQIPPRQP